jgi:hypothetical protein
VIGAAFIVLIITTWYAYYQFELNEQNRYLEIIRNNQELNERQNKESLEILTIVSTSENKINITLRNNGPNLSHLIYIGIINDSDDSVQYYSISEYIEPEETLTNVGNDSITIQEDEILIQVITKLGNVFSYNYPEDESDGSTTGGSSVTIKGNDRAYNPIQSVLIGHTEQSGGSVDDLQRNDASYYSFTSYARRMEYTDFVDNTSDVDGFPDVGSHSDFNLEKTRDSNYDLLSEEGVSDFGKIYYIKPSAAQDINNKWDNEANAWDVNNASSAVNSRGRATDNIYWLTWNNSGQGEILSIDLLIRLDFSITSQGGSSDSVTISWWVNGVQGLGTYTIDSSNDGTDILVSFLNVTEPNDGVWSWSDISNLEIRQIGTQGGPPDTLTYATDEVWGRVYTINYMLDLEAQWSNVNYNLTYEYLCIYAGNMGSENLQVDVWHNSSWNTVFSDLFTGWNNVSVSAYLDSSVFTIRFKGSVDSYDISQDNWEIDAALLYVYNDTDIQVLEVEFTGSSNIEDWDNLIWQIDSNFNVSSVTVSAQMYNYNTSLYPTFGDGFISYVSNVIPDTDEWVNQSIENNLSYYRNSTGHWLIKIKGEKVSIFPFEMNLDWLEFRPSYEWNGSVISFDTWQEYKVRGINRDSIPIRYAYTTIYTNGSSITMKNAKTGELLSNPDWVYLDENGEYLLKIKSNSISQETFIIQVVIGSLTEEISVNQNLP